jgi:Lar family restriction alleviation protein
MKYLRPCPFCGENNIQMKIGSYSIVTEKNHIEYTGFYYVVCGYCGVKTVEYKTAKAAMDAWNRRASDDS